MAGSGSGYGYAAVTDRGFVAFADELDQEPWKGIATKKYEEAAKESASVLLEAPLPVVWKLRLRFGIAGVLAALGAQSIAALDAAWDASQRRLFHRIAAAADDEDRTVRAAADRLGAKLLVGGGTGQTGFDLDDEVDFGRNQLALTSPDQPLAADVKKVKLEGALVDVEKTTLALAAGIGRGTGEKRRAPSTKVREAVAECVAAFNSVHDDLVWFIRKTSNGADREKLTALLAPLEALLSRNPPAATKDSAPATPEAPAGAAPSPEKKPA